MHAVARMVACRRSACVAVLAVIFESLKFPSVLGVAAAPPVEVLITTPGISFWGHGWGSGDNFIFVFFKFLSHFFQVKTGF